MVFLLSDRIRSRQEKRVGITDDLYVGGDIETTDAFSERKSLLFRSAAKYSTSNMSIKCDFSFSLG
jgi:hypothetical protein